MKIVVFGTRGFPHIQGGVEKYCEDLYPRISENFQVIVFRRTPFIKNNRKETYPNIRFIDLPSTKIKGFEALFHSLIATIISIFIHPDIAHVHNIGPALFAPLLRVFGINVILTYHSPNYEHSKWNLLERRLLRVSEKIALASASHIIFVNQFQKNKYTKNVQKKSTYIPNGITSNIKTNSKQYLYENNLKPDKYIVSVGRITPEKGFEYLIRAYQKTKQIEEYKLIIVGGEDHKTRYLSKLKKLAKKNSNIIFTGVLPIEKVGQLLSNARLFVLPSLNEGFPLVLLEAMSLNKDILVSDIPATRLIELDENDYFRTADIDDLAQKITQKLQFRSQQREYNLMPYNWETIATQVMEIYNSVLAGR